MPITLPLTLTLILPLTSRPLARLLRLWGLFARRLCISTVVLFGMPAFGDAPVVFDEAERRMIFQHSPPPPLSPDTSNRYADNPAAARLGHFLFFDPRFSANGAVSCATCHDPQRAFTDGRSLAEGIATGRRNTPTVLNAAQQRWLFWDGRSDTLWAQARHPLEDPAEMGASRLHVAHTLHADGALREAYEKLFGPLPPLDDRGRFPRAGGPHAANADERAAWDAMRDADRDAVNRILANFGKALAAYQRKLLTGPAPFDTFVEGLRENDADKLRAISPAAQRGLKLFIGRGECRSCHGGALFSDQEFHDVRAPLRGGGPLNDPGRYAGVETLKSDVFNAAGPYSDDSAGAVARRLKFLVNRPENVGRFRTPSLRNVALTPPYMREGQLATLEDVLRHYSTFENAAPLGHHGGGETILVPLELTPDETRDLLAFLESLTGSSAPKEWLDRPSGPLRSAVR